MQRSPKPLPGAAPRSPCWISIWRPPAKFAADIAAEGGTAKAYAANVLKKETLLEAREQIRRDFGTCDILVNGAGGNNPRATTTNEYYLDGDMEKDITTFFNLVPLVWSSSST